MYTDCKELLQRRVWGQNTGVARDNKFFNLCDSLLVHILQEDCKSLNYNKNLTKRVGFTPISHEFLPQMKRLQRNPEHDTVILNEDDYRTEKPGCLIVLSTNQTRRASAGRAKTWKSIEDLFSFDFKWEMLGVIDVKHEHRVFVNNPRKDLLDDVTFNTPDTVSYTHLTLPTICSV